ncbi:phosphatidylethanolamine-binding protein [Diplogelasinospora grovesii]|uniref:Phosphatidylethanolamine-binding protein n=1 Tax=Diplogelasinospora grovesii TaxID=303347 RepID=A0AAN6NEL5_9PEZI|nr:phosphatidylethanolamine-binding protein [Diplogelasinospora grovesii]
MYTGAEEGYTNQLSPVFICIQNASHLPATSLPTLKMPKEAESVKHLLATLSAPNATPTLRVHFPEKTVTQPGVKLSKAESAKPPTLSISSSLVTPDATGEKKYVVVALDLDPPFPSFPVMGPILHGLHADLTPGTTVEEGEANTEPIAVYVGPGPPPPSAPHRYVFLVFEQPPNMNTESMRERLGLGEKPGVRARVRWDQEAAEKKLGLGRVVAGNYFIC